MKNLFLSIIALGCTVVAGAQNEVATAILQHGDEATIFKGNKAVVDALAAADDDDVITISQGVFDGNLVITKSVSLLGAGMETNSELGIEQTQINGYVYIGSATENETITNVNIEGIYFYEDVYVGQNNNQTNRPVESLSITKCKISDGITFSSNVGSAIITKSVISQIQGASESIVVENMVVKNCHINGTVLKLKNESNVLIDHCNINGCYDRNYEYAQFKFQNCIFSSTAGYGNSNYWKTYNAMNSYVDHCIYNGIEHSDYYGVFMKTDYGNVTNCTQIKTSEIFSDADNGGYSPERTFEINNSETLLGTDNTQIGLLGGDGFSKVPSTPVVKSLTTTQEGQTLKVSYEAEVR
ncbi:MAG: hypothetical protein J6Y82_06400 [Bacteroidales bacterium]|nr:hypothetical protein [Bacteroidales bacterium]